MSIKPLTAGLIIIAFCLALPCSAWPCSQNSDGSHQQECGSQEVAARISFANFCFFVLHGLLTLCIRDEDDPRVNLHGGLFGWKTLLWLGAIVGFFFVPSPALVGYLQVGGRSWFGPAACPAVLVCRTRQAACRPCVACPTYGSSLAWFCPQVLMLRFTSC